MKSGRGRHQKYDKELLNSQLHKYALENKGIKIRLSSLTKATGIPRHIWEYNMMNEINLYNEPHFEIDDEELLEIPKINISCLVKKYENNHNKLEEVLNEIDFTLHACRENSLKYDKLKKKYEKLMIENKRLKEQNTTQKDMLLHLEHINKEMTIHSTSRLLRAKMGIEKNMLNINNQNDSITAEDMKKLTKKINDYKLER